MAQKQLTAVNMDGNPIENLPSTPTNGTDAASKDYVDASRIDLFVVANDATADEKLRADYQCDGTNDAVEINNALAVGRPVRLSSGTFSCNTTSVTITGDDTTSSPNQRFRGEGLEQTVLSFATNTDGVVISDKAKVDIGDFRIDVSGSGTGLKATAGATSDYRSFWMSTISRINVVGDFSTHSGWAYDFENPFRSTLSQLFSVGVKNGMQIRSTNSAFNPGNCVFSNCFMETNIADGIGYKIHSIDTGGNVNILTFIECDGQDSATSTSSIGWQLLGSTTTFYRTKDIVISHSNMESYNTVVDCNDAENVDITLNYAQTEGNGTIFDLDADCKNIRCRVKNLFVATGTTVNIFVDASTDDASPNYLYDSAGYNEGTMTITPGAHSILSNLSRNGPGVYPVEYNGALANTHIFDIDNYVDPTTYGVTRIRNSTGNFLSNSMFEQWSNGAAAAPDNWVVQGDATIARATNTLGLGTYQAEVTLGTANTGEFYAVFDASNEVDYTFSAYIKRTAGTGLLKLVAQENANDFTEYASVDCPTNSTKAFVALTVKPDDTGQCRINFKANGTATATYAFSEIMVQESKGLATTHQALPLTDSYDGTFFKDYTFKGAVTVEDLTVNGTVDGLDLAGNAMGTVVHGATAGTARPAGYSIVHWIGSVEPTNATNDDLWSDTS